MYNDKAGLSNTNPPQTCPSSFLYRAKCRYQPSSRLLNRRHLLKLPLILLPHLPIPQQPLLHPHFDLILPYPRISLETRPHYHACSLPISVIPSLRSLALILLTHQTSAGTSRKSAQLYYVAFPGTYTLNCIVKPRYMGEIAYPTPPSAAATPPH